ncbi:MAG: hypothetical protein HC927_07975 [Deltaproteobacteria bacterium]|nr:hypothetical protein [Deltaproteobacteria bacterium]
MTTENNELVLFGRNTLAAEDVESFFSEITDETQGNSVPWLKMDHKTGRWTISVSKEESRAIGTSDVLVLDVESIQLGWSLYEDGYYTRVWAPAGKSRRSIEKPVAKDEKASVKPSVRMTFLVMTGDLQGTEVQYTADSSGANVALGALALALQGRRSSMGVVEYPFMNLGSMPKATKWGLVHYPEFKFTGRWAAKGSTLSVDEPDTTQRRRRLGT